MIVLSSAKCVVGTLQSGRWLHTLDSSDVVIFEAFAGFGLSPDRGGVGGGVGGVGGGGGEAIHTRPNPEAGVAMECCIPSLSLEAPPAGVGFMVEGWTRQFQRLPNSGIP